MTKAKSPRARKVKLEDVNDAFVSIHDLTRDCDENTVYLPTTWLMCTVDEFKEALRRHGLTVDDVEGRPALKVSGARFLQVDFNGIGSNFYDHVGTEDPDFLIQEVRILPYFTLNSIAIVVLGWFRAVTPNEGPWFRYISAWPLMESASAEDTSQADKQVRAERAENDRIANLDKENVELKEAMAYLVRELKETDAFYQAEFKALGNVIPARRPLTVRPKILANLL